MSRLREEIEAIPVYGRLSTILSVMLDNVENRDFLKELLEAMYDELPATRKKK